MDYETARRLNAINRAFYARTARDFDATRQRPWSGWTRLLHSLDLPIDSLLDFGCGNARFARYLASKQTQSFAYCGVDSSAELLALAREQVASLALAKCELLERDIIMGTLPRQLAQLVVLFGLLHHVPGRRRRRELVKAAADCVLPGGWLAFTAWRFIESQRLRARIQPWDSDIKVEAGDYLLDWRRGERALRYCHYIDEEEHAELIAAAGLRVVDDYREDGGLNRYTVLGRSE